MHDTQVDGLRPAITSAPRYTITTEVAKLAMPAMPDEIERIAQGIGIELGLGLGRVTLNNKSSGIPGLHPRSGSPNPQPPATRAINARIAVFAR